MTCTGTPRALALSCRSVWVVALHSRFSWVKLEDHREMAELKLQQDQAIPEGIPDHQKCNVVCVCSAEDIISMLREDAGQVRTSLALGSHSRAAEDCQL